MNKTSRLDAVNTMLSALGNRPVNSIEPPNNADVDTALAILDEASREVQQRGWHFNTYIQVFTPDAGTNKILLPGNTLGVDSTSTTVNVVQVGDYLYDEGNNTFEFGGDVELEVIVCRDWDELPQPARTYIMLRATRKMVARVRGQDELRAPSVDEAEARADLEATDGRNADYNIFTNWAHYRVIDRVRRGRRGLEHG